jgi:iron complex outermembrane receptor protein
VPSAVWADPDPETIVIIDHAPDPEAARDRDRALGDAPFVTVVHPDEHPATASVADALGTTVGVQTRSLGGLGAYESITVRGAAPGHTIVLVDGVPLARIAAVTTDLGRFTLDAFGEAVNLVTRLGRGEHGERVTASLGAGSYGARHLRVHYGDDHGGLLSSTTLGYQGATGDYTYFYDNNTPLNTDDDSYKKRANNHFDQVDLASRIGTVDRARAGGLRVAYKDQGLPGSSSQPATAASLATLDVVGDARTDAHVGAAIARELGYVLVERQHLRDPLAELGLGAQARDYLTLSGGASSTWLAAIGRHRATAGVELRGDRFRDADAGAARAALVGDREGGALLAAVDVAVDRDAALVVTPAVRLDAVRTAPTPMLPAAPAAEPMTSVPARTDVVPSPRMTLRAAVTGDVSLKASAGWYVRLPTLIELFGDRGTIVGTPELRPERGPSADAGIVYAPARALEIPNADLGAIVVDRVLVEAAGFATRPHDTIALVPTAGFVVHAANVADAQTYGGELVGSARIARTVSLTANYTRLVTAQLVADPAFANKALPRQPEHAVYARADVVRRALGAVWFDVNWQSDTFLDQANLQRVPGRLLLGTGMRVEVAADLALVLAVENLADVRVEQLPLVPAPRPDLHEVPTPVADVAGFPLPGRSFYLSVEWSHK